MSNQNKIFIHYDVHTDYLEVANRKCETVAEDLGNGIFVLKSLRGAVVGHGAIDANTRLEDLDFLDPFLKLAVQIKIARLKRGYTQEQMAKRMGIGLLPYQRLESGGNNPTFKTILKLKEALPEVSLDKIAS